MTQLQDKVCLITGAARGQGAEEARLFASEGASVWLTDVLDEAGYAVAEECDGNYLHLDVRHEEDWRACVDKVIDVSGRLDVLVNNAGIFRSGGISDTQPKQFEEVMSINCTGTFLGMRAVAPHMRAAGSGSIVNISSVAGLTATPMAIAYGASKWAVRGMTKAAAAELGKAGVRVNSIHPGIIETDMLHQVPGFEPGNVDRAIKRVPLGRVAEAREVARLALFLASDESAYCTGAEFVIDGGITLR